MNRIIAIGVVLVVALVAAVAFLSPPDTGAPLPPDPASDAASVATKPLPTPAAAPEPQDGPPPHPIEARRMENDAMLVGSLGSAWTGIRRELSGMDDPRAADVKARVAALITGLRDARRNPDGMDLSALLAEQDDLRKLIVDEGLVNPMISTQLLRLDALKSEYPVD